MNGKKLLVLLLVVVMSCSLFFIGCSEKNNDVEQGSANSGEGTETGDTGDANQEPEMDEDQTINVSMIEPKTLDIALSSDTYSGDIFTQTMEGLTRLVEDEEGNDVVKPAGAKSWDISKDGLVWTFHLRDYNWEDGVKVKAQDFEYGIKRTLAPDTASKYAFLMYPIKNAEEYNSGKANADDLGVKALNDNTLEITLKDVCPYFGQLINFKTFLPQRKDKIEEFGEKFGSEAEYFISCGPFKLTKWLHNNEIVVEKNENYWDKDVVKLQKVNMKIITDPNARYNALFSGTIDSCGVTKPEWIEKFEKSGKFRNIKSVDPSCNYQFYNQKDELFKNANIRKAFSIAITREDMADVIFHGAYEAAYAWIPPGIQLGDKEYRSLNKEMPVKMISADEPDPKKLLVKGLTELGLDPDPSKHTVTMLMSGTDDWDRTYAEYMQQMFKIKMGINMDAKYVEWDMFQKLVDDGDYQIGGMAWGADYNDPMTFLDFFISTSGMVNTGWENKEFDEIIAKAAVEMDDTKRLEYYSKAERILVYEDAVIAPTVSRSRNTFRAKYVKKLMSPLFGSTDFKYAYIQGRN